jgi:Rod binding domain-containing protein
MKVEGKSPIQINQKHKASNRFNVNRKKTLTVEEARKPFEKVAEGMETQFVNHMLNQMRKTVPQDKPDSNEVSYYKSLMDYEVSKAMASDPRGGIGIKKMVLEEILPHHLKENRKTNLAKMNPYKKGLEEISHE